MTQIFRKRAGAVAKNIKERFRKAGINEAELSIGEPTKGRIKGAEEALFLLEPGIEDFYGRDRPTRWYGENWGGHGY